MDTVELMYDKERVHVRHNGIVKGSRPTSMIMAMFDGDVRDCVTAAINDPFQWHAIQAHKSRTIRAYR